MSFPVADAQGRVICPNFDGSTSVRRVSYNRSNGRSYQCVPSSRGAFHLAKWMRANHPYLTEINVPGVSARRQLNEGELLDGHRAGYAIDLGIHGNPASWAQGGLLADWLVTNAEAIGIQMVIFLRTAWIAGGPAGGRWMEYTGDSPHEDHIHLDLSPSGATRQASWFRSNPEPQMADNSRRLVFGTTSSSGGLGPAGSAVKPYEFEAPTGEEAEGTGKFASDEEARWLLEVQTGVRMAPSTKGKSTDYRPFIVAGAIGAVFLAGLALIRSNRAMVNA